MADDRIETYGSTRKIRSTEVESWEPDPTITKKCNIADEKVHGDRYDERLN